MNWTDILKPYAPKVLSEICRAFGMTDYVGKIIPSNRLRALDQLRRHMGKKELVRSALDRIGPIELAIIRILIADGGHAETEKVRRTVEMKAKTRPATPAEIPNAWYQGVPSFEDAVLRTTCYGLVFTRDNHEIDFRPGKFMFIPDPVMNLINADPDWTKALAIAPAPEAERASIPAPELISTIAAADFQRDLSRYLRHVRKQKEVPLTTVGWIYKANFKTFLTAMNASADAANDEASNGRLWFMRRLLSKLGEIHPNENLITANLSGTLLLSPIAERVKRAFTAWNETGAWNELNRISNDHQGYDYRREAPPELTKARATILRAITRMATSASQTRHKAAPATSGEKEEGWISTEQLIDQVRRSDYEFLFPRKFNYREMFGATGFYGTPYYSTNNPYGISFPSVNDEKSGWDAVERQVIVAMLAGPLFWMGLVSLGYAKNQTPSENMAPVAFRLTQTGAWLLGLANQPEFIETGGRVLLQPNFTIIAMEPISDSVLLALDEFAESQGGDRAITYHLTRQSVYHAQRQGWGAQRICAFLEQHQGAPIPANVQRSLDEWQLQHQRITFHRSACVIQYADVKARDSAQQALLQAGKTTQSLAPMFDLIERKAEGKATTPSELSTMLNAAGWMPLLTPGNDGTVHTQNSLRITENAEVLFKESVPSLFTLSQLQPFAEQDGERSRISASSVRAAMTKGVTLDHLLSILIHLNGGPLPGKVEINIRAWAGFYGHASLQQVHLLELSSLEVLNNLLNDEQVGAFLRPIDAAAYPLAFVDPKHAEVVRNALIERGVTLK